jgi:hypothetical protein
VYAGQGRALDDAPPVAASVRTLPRMTPMQGVQPIAKTTPSPNDASQPPRDETRLVPSEWPTPPPSALARASVP